MQTIHLTFLKKEAVSDFGSCSLKEVSHSQTCSQHKPKLSTEVSESTLLS